MFGKWIEETPHPLENNEIVRVKQWMAILLITMLPVINLVPLLYWALAGKDDEHSASLVNWARAMLIMMLIVACVSAPCIFICLRLISG